MNIIKSESLGTEESHLFAHLVLLILVLLILNLAPSSPPELLGLSSGTAFGYGFFAYLITLTGILGMNRTAKALRCHEEGPLSFLAATSLLCFLSLFYLIFAGHLFYAQTTLFQNVQVLNGIVALCFYFGGLFVHFSFAHYLDHPSPLTATVHYGAAFKQVRFLLPFALPYLLFESFRDVLRLLPEASFAWLPNASESPLLSGLISIGGSLVVFGLLMTFMPALIQWIWGCKPLEDNALKERLEALCKRAGFRHAGMRLWTVMDHVISAAIIGIVPRFRYVMFTRGLLEELSPRELEAVLAHEIGHSRHKHLIIFPFIIMGMMISTGLVFLLFQDSLSHFFALQTALGNGAFWSALQPFVIFVPYAVMIGLYFRLVFGFFSRQFERQADLQPIELGIPAEEMINALNRVGDLSGGKHAAPNWHHFSLQQRMDFLVQAAIDPSLIRQHHRWVHRLLIGYFIALSFGATAFFSPFLPSTPGFAGLNRGIRTISTSISSKLNSPLRQSLSQDYLRRYHPPGNRQAILKSFDLSLTRYEALVVPGIFEFYAAQFLLREQQTAASIELMTAAWEHFDFTRAPDDVPERFRIVTLSILKASESNDSLLDERLALFEAMRRVAGGVPQSSSHPPFHRLPGA